MKFTYLIDYENVRDEGLEGLFDLSGSDTVNIFYTVNADRMSFAYVSRLLKGDCRAEINFFEVAPGNQSLDKHLSSYLGFLLGRESSDDNMYIIISKDNGYLPVINFWNSDGEIRARVFPRIKTCLNYFSGKPVTDEEMPGEIADDNSSAENPENKTVEKTPVAKVEKEDGAKKGQKETVLNNSVQQTLSKNKTDGKVITKVLSIVNSHRKDPANKILTAVRNDLIKQFKQEQGGALYKAIKPHIADYKKD